MFGYWFDLPVKGGMTDILQRTLVKENVLSSHMGIKIKPVVYIKCFTFVKSKINGGDLEIPQ